MCALKIGLSLPAYKHRARQLAVKFLSLAMLQYRRIFKGSVMPQVNRSALVMFSARQMYDLVNDVESYPEFLPGCIGSRVVSIDGNVMVASVDVSKAGISKTFTTRNTLIENERVDMKLVDGPFKLLEGGWTFISLDDNACKVSLDLSFEFDNKLAEFAFGKIFKELAGNMVSAFSERAKVVYE